MAGQPVSVKQFYKMKPKFTNHHSYVNTTRVWLSLNKWSPLTCIFIVVHTIELFYKDLKEKLVVEYPHQPLSPY